MGEMKGTINFHYSKGNLDILEMLAEDLTLDDDDIELAKKYVNELKNNKKLIDDDNEGR